jgi:hypothetical protein
VGWGPELQLNVTYCDKLTNRPVYEFEMTPQSAIDSGDVGAGEPRITYYGPYGVADNVRCIAVAEVELTSLNKLFYSSMFAKSSGFEQLYFKKLVSRHAKAIKSNVIKTIRSVKPLARKTSVERTPPTVLGEPDLDAQKACFVKVMVRTT